ncbi:MFS transporter [Streptomyces sp. MST-110588]|uniref:MFS transporter n=1 Tax=Streptomyces sp. MST-110588 TaxID=2833628 RepID=UPI001F5DF06A|nr:MFS transporter [Streptomyces sp. MST-110588]UNO43410.1 MFS transporter [Streptomyces sp. MST-110588]
MVPEHRRGTAVARVSLGLSLAMIAGLPLGTVIGRWLSWQATFAAVALLAVVAAGPLPALVRAPYAGSAPATEPLITELRVLTERRVQAVVAVTALGAAAAFTAYTFITPLLTEAAGFTASAVTLLLLLFGVGGTVGNLIGGKLADRSVARCAPRWRPWRERCCSSGRRSRSGPAVGGLLAVLALGIALAGHRGDRRRGDAPAAATRDRTGSRTSEPLHTP